MFELVLLLLEMEFLEGVLLLHFDLPFLEVLADLVGGFFCLISLERGCVRRPRGRESVFAGLVFFLPFSLLLRQDLVVVLEVLLVLFLFLLFDEGFLLEDGLVFLHVFYIYLLLILLSLILTLLLLLQLHLIVITVLNLLLIPLSLLLLLQSLHPLQLLLLDLHLHPRLLSLLLVPQLQGLVQLFLDSSPVFGLFLNSLFFHLL